MNCTYRCMRGERMKYLDFPSNDACVNLAMEYYVTEKALFPGEDICWFWNTVPTVVIGKYQVAQAEANLPYLEENGIALVRRHSGGGAIYSDENNLMFSIITKSTDDGLDFQKFTTPLIDLFNRWGIPATHSGRNDLLLHGKKFSGNAQFHYNGYTVHHGTMLIDTDFDALTRAITPPQEKIVSKGVASVREHVINLKPYLPKDVLDRGLACALRDALTDGVLTFTKEQQREILSIADERFRGWDVLFGKSPKFTVTRTKKFAGGTLTLELEVEHGIIKHAVAFGDFFGDSAPLCAALCGVPATREDLYLALQNIVLPHQIDLDGLVEMLTDVSGR
ncbi:MAG: lipoate--protein ligase [Ruminococcaceae bacterium]|nr:lipoate--protein ligase [Oscillospiraceae bacterium]